MMDKEKAVPELRFQGFEGEWEKKKLGSILERVSKPVDVQSERNYQQIGIRSHGKGIFHKEIVDGKALGDKRVFWVIEDALVLNIVFAWEQAVAVTSQNEVGMIASHRFPMYRSAGNEANTHYLHRFFLTKKGKSLLEMASPGGAGRNKTLGQKEFERLKFFIPTLPEQQKIAAFLTAIDVRLQGLRKAKGLLEAYKKGVMQQLFSRKLRFNDKNGKGWPVWVEKRIKDLCEVVGGGTPETDKPSYWNGKINWFTPTEIKENYVSKSLRTISELGLKNSSAKLLPKGTILLTTRATVGEASINTEESTTNQGFQSLIVKKGTSNLFIFQWIKGNKHELVKRASGSTFPEISKKSLENIIVPTPSLSEQTKIANFLSALDDKIAQSSRQIAAVESWKQGLMQKMFV